MYRIASHAAHTRFSRTMLSLAAGVAALALPAAAQIDLTLTAADNGNFQVAATPPNSGGPPQPGYAAINCSRFSPQFSNDYVQMGNALIQAYTGPSSCVQTLTLWVVNKGNSPTLGAAAPQITVSVALTPVQPKGSTVLSTNGYCAFPSGCGANIQIGVDQFGNPVTAPNLGGTPTPAANGWNCAVNQGNVTCTRAATDVLAAGATLPPIVIRLTREDFSPLTSWGDVASVSGGGPDADPTNNTLFDDPLNWQLSQQITFGSDGRYVDIHSVPEGLLVRVDGQLVKTPHTDFWLSGSTHSVDGADDNGNSFGLPFGQTGTTFPNFPWILNSATPVIGSITGTIKNNTLWTTLPPNVVTGSTNYEAITFLYHK